MKWSWFGRTVLALTSAVSLGLGMTACGGGTVAYLWAIGNTSTGNGEIVGYKVDHFTGNLTATPGSPFTTGKNPVHIVVRPGGGRFVYVINQGTGYTSTSAGTSEGIDEFAVGGEGTLTFENHYTTQGYGHLWAAFDSTGNYLYVLDKYSQNYQPDPNKPNYNPNGAITAFTSDPTDGRLKLYPQTASTQPGQPAPNFLPVGQSPVRMLSTGTCLYTVNNIASGNQTVSIYGIGTAGQLNTVTTGTYQVNGAVSITSIAGNSQYVFLTDNTNGSGPGQIFNYTVGSNCALVPFSTGPVTSNSATAANPQNAFVTTSSSQSYVYVLNGPNNNTSATTSGSLISGFNIVTGQLNPTSTSPTPAGAGPVCMVEDPTSEYVYEANSLDGTITGYTFSNPNGALSPLARGSLFKTPLLTSSCLAISGSI